MVFVRWKSEARAAYTGPIALGQAEKPDFIAIDECGIILPYLVRDISGFSGLPLARSKESRSRSRPDLE